MSSFCQHGKNIATSYGIKKPTNGQALIYEIFDETIEPSELFDYTELLIGSELVYASIALFCYAESGPSDVFGWIFAELCNAKPCDQKGVELAISRGYKKAGLL